MKSALIGRRKTAPQYGIPLTQGKVAVAQP